MREQKITLEIAPDGGISADAEGFTGDVCVKDLERLLEGLAPGAHDLRRKPDAGAARVSAAVTQRAGKKP